MSDPIPLKDLEGRRITSSDIQQSMRINIAAGFMGMIWFAMTVNTSLTLFMEAIGASGVMIGLLMTVRQLVMAVQIPAALVFEHLPESLGSRKRFWAIPAMVHRLLWFAIAGLALCWKPGAWWLPVVVISVVGLSDLCANTSAAAWFSWMADLIPAKTSGRFWGQRQSIVTAGSLLGVGLAGWLLDFFRVPGTGKTSALGFCLVFGVGAICGVTDIIVHLWVKEPRRAPIAHESRILERLLAPLRVRDFRHLTLAMGGWYGAVAMVAPFSIVCLKREFPVTYLHIAALTIAGSLGSVLTSFVFGALTDRLGARVLASIMMILAPFTAASWFFVNTSFLTFDLPWIGLWSVPQVVVYQAISMFFGGAVFSAVGPCQLRLAARLSNASGRTMAMAVHWSLIGVLASLGSLIGGWIMDWCRVHPPHVLLPNGASFSFIHIIIGVFAVVVWGAVVPLVLSIRTPVDHVAFGEAVSRMFFINPFNAVRNFYNIQITSAPFTADERAQAARSLGVHKSGMAIPNLSDQLNDPAMAVQEEAIEALGSIGTREAVDALLEKLEDPACDLVPQICKALRHSADARCVDPLLRKLVGNDRETLSECARTLGRIGDRRAIPHLLNLITYTRDSKVLAASSEALAALGELSAAYQIIPQMRAAPNKVLRRALAVATGDLLGEREAFYRLLIADTESAGTGVSQVARDLSRAIKKQFPLALRQVETLEMLESAYHEGQVSRCAELLLHLGLHLVQFMHRLPITLDPNEAMARLLECDRRAAMGVWYLKILNEPWLADNSQSPDHRDLTAVLLGLHIVLSFTGE